MSILMFGGDPLSEEDLEELIEYLNDNSNDGMQPKWGLEIEFMERNGHDSGLLYPWLFYELNNEFSPLRGGSLPDFSFGDGPPVSHEVASNIALQLRGYYRQKFHLPKLTVEERQTWQPRSMPCLLPEEATTKTKIAATSEITQQHIMFVAEKFRENYSEIYSYLLSVKEKSELQGYTHNTNQDREVGRTSLVGYPVSHIIKKYFEFEGLHDPYFNVVVAQYLYGRLPDLNGSAP